MTGIPYELRPYRGAPDDAMIFHSWCKQIRRCRPFCFLEPDAFRGYKAHVLEPLVAGSTVLVASNPADPDHIHGWACGARVHDCDVLHMVYVREPARGQGKGSALVGALFPRLGTSPILVSHPTRMLGKIERRWNLVYAPQMAHPWPVRSKEDIACSRSSTFYGPAPLAAGT